MQICSRRHSRAFLTDILQVVLASKLKLIMRIAQVFSFSLQNVSQKCAGMAARTD